ncbi:hypothetical protein E2542_SST10517 [Spatholobus suberectus]|nr:hypothetical protein E2542_SST10517 [Spatholobus suberectus]
MSQFQSASLPQTETEAKRSSVWRQVLASNEMRENSKGVAKLGLGFDHKSIAVKSNFGLGLSKYSHTASPYRLTNPNKFLPYLPI